MPGGGFFQCRAGVVLADVLVQGDDLFGDFILRALESVGVDTSAIRRQSPPTRTTLAFVEVSEDGDREFTFYRSVPAADEHQRTWRLGRCRRVRRGRLGGRARRSGLAARLAAAARGRAEGGGQEPGEDARAAQHGSHRRRSR